MQRPPGDVAALRPRTPSPDSTRGHAQAEHSLLLNAGLQFPRGNGSLNGVTDYFAFLGYTRPLGPLFTSTLSSLFDRARVRVPARGACMGMLGGAPRARRLLLRGHEWTSALARRYRLQQAHETRVRALQHDRSSQYCHKILAFAAEREPQQHGQRPAAQTPEETRCPLGDEQ